ncbi:hypothetical protein ACH5RR_008335 [Cinchona calisaya]|uniref:Uncharacterized protein n=1 Tax=Cinchona calisaya TaxID=153742 RepID=A0ABD3ACZ2_9GENT
MIGTRAGNPCLIQPCACHWPGKANLSATTDMDMQRKCPDLVALLYIPGYYVDTFFDDFSLAPLLQNSHIFCPEVLCDC